jgi:hypothetical protein
MLWYFNWSIQILFGNILWNFVIMNKVGKFARGDTSCKIWDICVSNDHFLGY